MSNVAIGFPDAQLHAILAWQHTQMTWKCSSAETDQPFVSPTLLQQNDGITCDKWCPHFSSHLFTSNIYTWKGGGAMRNLPADIRLSKIHVQIREASIFYELLRLHRSRSSCGMWEGTGYERVSHSIPRLDQVCLKMNKCLKHSITTNHHLAMISNYVSNVFHHNKAIVWLRLPRWRASSQHRNMLTLAATKWFDLFASSFSTACWVLFHFTCCVC